MKKLGMIFQEFTRKYKNDKLSSQYEFENNRVPFMSRNKEGWVLTEIVDLQ